MSRVLKSLETLPLEFYSLVSTGTLTLRVWLIWDFRALSLWPEGVTTQQATSNAPKNCHHQIAPDCIERTFILPLDLKKACLHGLEICAEGNLIGTWRHRVVLMWKMSATGSTQSSLSCHRFYFEMWWSGAESCLVEKPFIYNYWFTKPIMSMGWPTSRVENFFSFLRQAVRIICTSLTICRQHLNK